MENNSSGQLAFAPTITIADHAPSLKEIMQWLRNNLIEISDGLLTDDFELIRQSDRS